MTFAKFTNPSVNPTIGTDAYTANDVVGGLLQFSVAGLAVNGGILNQAILVDEDGLSAEFNLYLFESLPSTIADDAAFEPTIDDLNKLVAIVNFSSYNTINSIDVAITEDINNVFTTTNAILYGYLVAVGTPNPTTADGVTVRLYIASDQ